MKLVCFDLDGTLAKLDISNEKLNKEIQLIIGKKDERLMGFWNVYELYPKEAREKDRELKNMLRRYEKKNIDNGKLEPIDEGIEVLRMCKGRAKVAITSNNTSATIEEVIKKLDITVDYIIGIDCVKNPKPQPDMLIETMKELDAEKNETIIIGDSIYDLIAAVKAGIMGIDATNWKQAKSILELML